jgi:cytosine/adenosine deaminase-related metal-dependent hydrolase
MQHLDEIGALGPWLTLAHMVWIEDSDIPLLAERGVRIDHNPSSNLRLRSGIAPVAALHHAGVRVGIGLDGHGLDDDQDYLREMRLAFTLGNRPAASAPELSPLTVIDMATRSGAGISFGEEAPLGALASGYLADVVLMDWLAVKGDWCPPDYPSEAHLPEFFLRRATRQHVRHVMVHGEWVLRDGKHTRLDEAQVNRAVRDELASQPVPVPSQLAPYVRQFYAAWERDAV